MIKKVPVKKLRIGVYVEKIEQSWLMTPFFFNKFKIASEKEIKKMEEYGIEEVYINTEKGLDAIETAGEKEKPMVQEKKPTEFFGAPPGKLMVDSVLPFDLYIKKGADYFLYLRKNLPFHFEVNHYLESNRVKTIYIPCSQRDLFNSYEKGMEREWELSHKGLSKGFESEEKIERYIDYLDNYIPVDREVFVPGTRTPVNLYLENHTDVSLILKAERMVPDDDVFGKEEEGKKRKNLLIHINDNEKYRNFIRELAVKKSSGDSEAVVKMRAAVVKENSKMVTKDLLENPRSGEAVKEAKKTVAEMIDAILNLPSSFYGLMKINTYDYYTYVHSINVCTLSIGLAMSLGMREKDLFNLALGSLMHDVGKSRVPSHLINKPGKLTDQEFDLVKKHVEWGADLMREHQDLSPSIFIPLLQHHEKLNGRGYPKNLEQEQIHVYGRISCIVDIYDALTTERSYKKAFRPFEAASLLSKQPEEFDQSIFKHFVTMLGKQTLDNKH